MPTGPLGAVWLAHPQLQEGLGFALTADATSAPLAIQSFAGGDLLWTPDRVITALYAGGAYARWEDRYGR